MAKKYISKENFELIWAAAKLKLAGKLDNPEGGETGNVLSKTETGTEWIDIDSKYATKEELQEGLEEIDITDQLEDFVKKDELKDYAKKDEVLTEDDLSDYLTADDIKDLAKKSEVTAVQSDLDEFKETLEGTYATKDEIADLVSSDDFDELKGTVDEIKEDYVTSNDLTEAKSEVKNEIIGTAPGTYETLTAIAKYIEEHGEAAAALTEQIASKADKTELDNYYTKVEIDAMDLTAEEINAIMQ